MPANVNWNYTCVVTRECLILRAVCLGIVYNASYRQGRVLLSLERSSSARIHRDEDGSSCGPTCKRAYRCKINRGTENRDGLEFMIC